MQLYLHFLCLSYVTVTASGDTCLVSPAVQNDMYMKHYSYRRIVTSTLHECASECMASFTCESFNFDIKSRTCDLNNNSSDQVNLNPRPDFIFSDIKHWNKSLAGSCSTVSCGVSSRCQAFRKDQTRCVPEFKECGKPPNVADADVVYSGVFLHAEANYTCRRDFRPCSSNTRSVCLGTGKWSDIGDICERFKWERPTVDFVAKLPCKNQGSPFIKVNATPIKKKGMTFDLRRGRDLLLHASLRLMSGTAVVNAFLNGVWGSEIRTRSFPFTVNNSFLIEFALKNGKYQVSVNGRPYLSLQERIPDAQSDTFRIRGYLKIESVIILGEGSPPS